MLDSASSLWSGVVHREGGEHHLASQPRHSEHPDQEGLPADRAAGQGRAGREPQRPSPSCPLEAVHVPQSQRQQEERGTFEATYLWRKNALRYKQLC